MSGSSAILFKIPQDSYLVQVLSCSEGMVLMGVSGGRVLLELELDAVWQMAGYGAWPNGIRHTIRPNGIRHTIRPKGICHTMSYVMPYMSCDMSCLLYASCMARRLVSLPMCCSVLYGMPHCMPHSMSAEIPYAISLPSLATCRYTSTCLATCRYTSRCFARAYALAVKS